MLEAVGRLGDDVVGTDRRVPVGELERLGRDDVLGPSLEADDTAVDKEVRGLRTVAARVHPDGAADRARYPDRPLQPGETGRRGSSRQDRVGGRTARTHAIGFDLDTGEAVGEPHAQSREAGIGDEQVRPLPEHHDRDRGRCRRRQPAVRGPRCCPVH